MAMSNQNQIKSILLSHHHSTCALVSEILESVLQTVQIFFTYRQYILTDLYRWPCAEYIYSVLDILTVINTRYTPYVHILHYVHIYIHIYVKVQQIINKLCVMDVHVGVC